MTSFALAIVLGTTGDQLTLITSGMTSKLRGYMPVRAEMGPPVGIAKAPVGFTNAQYGTFKFGSMTFAFALDEPEGQPAKFYVDSNGDSDLTNDGPTVWTAKTTNGLTMYQGSAQVNIGGQLCTVNAYRFDKNDAARASLKNILLYYPDFGYEGQLSVGGKDYKLSLAGVAGQDARVWIDRNENGKNDGRSESFMANEPFNFGGTTYALSFGAGSYTANKSSETVAEIPLPPDLSVGKPVLTFQATAMDGTKINFPSTFKGKVVMLDFWATWCGPCIAELPNVIKAYEKYHDRGFEVLGVSFDQENMADKVTAFTKEHSMPWMQIYEGKYWKTTLGLKFGVEGIPFCLLVDGDTGTILANVGKLRGENLDKTLQEVLAKRGK